jgi:hypothetical protein
VPYKCGIAVERDNQIVWSGIITARRYAAPRRLRDHVSPACSPTGGGGWSPSNRVYTNTDQFDIVGRPAAGRRRPDGAARSSTLPLSGVKRDRSIDVTDQKPVLDAIMELADNLNGYEIAIESDWSALPGVQRVVHNLRLGSPRLGRPASSGALLMLEYPGNVREYTWDEDGEEFATEVWGCRPATTAPPCCASAVNNTLLGRASRA